MPRPPSQANERQRNLLRGFVGRLSGDSGFQLINVTNVPILLSQISMDNSLVNRVSLVNKLWRHYSWIAFAQASAVRTNLHTSPRTLTPPASPTPLLCIQRVSCCPACGQVGACAQRTRPVAAPAPQAGKVLGGAGPAMAAIPASLIWGTLALWDLGQDVASKRAGPLQVRHPHSGLHRRAAAGV